MHTFESLDAEDRVLRVVTEEPTMAPFLFAGERKRLMAVDAANSDGIARDTEHPDVSRKSHEGDFAGAVSRANPEDFAEHAVLPDMAPVPAVVVLEKVDASDVADAEASDVTEAEHHGPEPEHHD